MRPFWRRTDIGHWQFLDSRYVFARLEPDEAGRWIVWSWDDVKSPWEIEATIEGLEEAKRYTEVLVRMRGPATNYPEPAV